MNYQYPQSWNLNRYFEKKSFSPPPFSSEEEKGIGDARIVEEAKITYIRTLVANNDCKHRAGNGVDFCAHDRVLYVQMILEKRRSGTGYDGMSAVISTAL
jgi:hypothetical protein